MHIVMCENYINTFSFLIILYKDLMDDAASSEDKTCGKKLKAIAECFEKNYDYYLSEANFMGANAGFYYAAAYLDPSSWIFMSPEEQRKAEEWLTDTVSTAQERRAPSAGGDDFADLGFLNLPGLSGLSSAHESAAAPGEFQPSAADTAIKEYKAILQSLATEQRSKIPPTATVEEKKKLVEETKANVYSAFSQTNPLKFYANLELEGKNPLLLRWAALILPVRINEAHVEALFSKAGRTWDVLRAATFGSGTGCRLTLLRVWYLDQIQRDLESKRLAKSSGRCKRFFTIVGDKLIEEVINPEAEEEDDDEEEDEGEEATDSVAKAWYEGDVKPCPAAAKLVDEKVPIAIYFEDINQWQVGTLKYNNRHVTSRRMNNMTVEYKGEGIWNFSLHPENYGVDKFWVLPDN